MLKQFFNPRRFGAMFIALTLMGGTCLAQAAAHSKKKHGKKQVTVRRQNIKQSTKKGVSPRQSDTDACTVSGLGSRG